MPFSPAPASWPDLKTVGRLLSANVDLAINYALHFFVETTAVARNYYQAVFCYYSVMQLHEGNIGPAPVAQGKRQTP